MTSHRVMTQLRNPEHLSYPPPLLPYLYSLLASTPEVFSLAFCHLGTFTNPLTYICNHLGTFTNPLSCICNHGTTVPPLIYQLIRHFLQEDFSDFWHQRRGPLPMCSTKPGTVHLRVDGTLDSICLLYWSSPHYKLQWDTYVLIWSVVVSLPSDMCLAHSATPCVYWVWMNDFCVPREWS